MLTVLMFFAVACVLCVLARMASAPIPAEGVVDLQRNHLEEGRKYAALFAVECALTIGTVFLYGSTSQNWVASNLATLMTAMGRKLPLRQWQEWIESGHSTPASKVAYHAARSTVPAHGYRSPRDQWAWPLRS
jgi:disulfide bond formation protein DsbB